MSLITQIYAWCVNLRSCPLTQIWAGRQTYYEARPLSWLADSGRIRSRCGRTESGGISAEKDWPVRL